MLACLLLGFIAVLAVRSRPADPESRLPERFRLAGLIACPFQLLLPVTCLPVSFPLDIRAGLHTEFQSRRLQGI